MFVALLKSDCELTEEEIIEMSKSDMKSRQDIDLCYWGHDESEEINEITKKRLCL